MFTGPFLFFFYSASNWKRMWTKHLGFLLAFITISTSSAVDTVSVSHTHTHKQVPRSEIHFTLSGLLFHSNGFRGDCFNLSKFNLLHAFDGQCYLYFVHCVRNVVCSSRETWAQSDAANWIDIIIQFLPEPRPTTPTTTNQQNKRRKQQQFCAWNVHGSSMHLLLLALWVKCSQCVRGCQLFAGCCGHQPHEVSGGWCGCKRTLQTWLSWISNKNSFNNLHR